MIELVFIFLLINCIFVVWIYLINLWLILFIILIMFWLNRCNVNILFCFVMIFILFCCGWCEVVINVLEWLGLKVFLICKLILFCFNFVVVLGWIVFILRLVNWFVILKLVKLIGCIFFVLIRCGLVEFKWYFLWMMVCWVFVIIVIWLNVILL